MFDTLLIANRGEIARRINRTAQAMGIRTVAVYSEADAQALHVQECDLAVCLGAPEAAKSYLNIDAIVKAALATGAQAVHPGYGFLSENAAFAKACAEAGLIFVGPDEHAIRVMGSKSEAKACVQQAGVPLIPGYFGDDQSVATLQAEADKMGYPLMIKAVAGGGGKGIRTVHEVSGFVAALESCQREAKNAFADPTVMLEKLIVNPRHVEVQVFADQHGNVVHLFERDCSAQRRHQKVIEEAPAFGLTDAQRKGLGDTAVQVARSVNYRGAGTVEFLMDASGAFYFMEMNTRLQVEHPVTEMVTGFDLVSWQLKIAAGEPLPVQQADIRLTGHAFEARLYAENPDNGFLPAIGKVALWRGPDHASEFAVPTSMNQAAVRMDGAMRSGLAISPYYDPMVGKLIVWGATRDKALNALQDQLLKLRCVGVRNNIAWLHTLSTHPEFARGGYDTGLIDRMEAARTRAVEPDQSIGLAALCALGRWAKGVCEQQGVGATDPLLLRDGFASAAPLLRTDVFSEAGKSESSWPVRSHCRRQGARVQVIGALGPAGKATSFDHAFELPQEPVLTGEVLRIVAISPEMGEIELIWNADLLHVFGRDHSALLLWHNPAHIRVDQGDAGHGVNAPMPGKVFAVLAKPGDTVKKGQPLIGLEAMKMEHMLLAPADAVVKAVPFGLGQQVNEGVALVLFEE
ncbi:MAG TPA: biotin carboxylase N-terminal domain-containing protein [Limnobacter sp.]|uniref:ATP-binding protein n=1 Tax=Limnobacter sp. TaxID=2003368 RepID=UPI002E32964B|nr:biotin carboxylase N-terminal domain-containing protein [Limnobacter sp.]HEX5484633.1 biotin carboxylase N-terminal domain-containing protein [Limnobacter sp.]